MKHVPDIESWLSLNLIDGLGGESIRRLLVAFGNPATILSAHTIALERIVKNPIAKRIKQGADRNKIAGALKWLEDPINAIITLADPDYPAQVMEKMQESLTEFMTRAGVSEEQIEEGLNRNSMAEKFSVMGQIKSFFFSIIFYAIFSLIVAAIAKRNPPMFENKTL